MTVPEVATATGEAATTPETVRNATGISQENDFEAVGAQRTIESDAELIAQNRAQYQVAEVTSVPSRSGSGGAGIVEFALSTTHAPGIRVYRRAGIAQQARHTRNCAKYTACLLYTSPSPRDS